MNSKRVVAAFAFDARWVSLALVLGAFALGCGSSAPDADGGASGSGSSGAAASSGSGRGSGTVASGSGSGLSGSGLPGGSSGMGLSLPDGGISGDDAAAGSGSTGATLDGGAVIDSMAAGPETGVAPPPGDGGVGWGSVPGILARIVPPTFPSVDCDVTKYGGVGDGATDNTMAFATAITDCVAKGGGRVVTPAGTFFTGPIELKSNINLYVAAGATIKFTTDPMKYLPPVEVSWEGSFAMNYHPLIWAHDATNVAITGTGTIDGNASRSNWYAWGGRTQQGDQQSLRTQNASGVPIAQRVYGQGHFLRPGLIEFMRCTNVLFDGFTAMNSPFWTIHPVLSKNITARNFHSVSDITVVNTDGFDPEACTDVLIQNATIQVGDDAVAVKAGRNRDAMTYYKPSENIVIQKSTMLSTWGGVTIGSEMSGGVRNVYVEDCTFSSAAGNLIYGFFIKSTTTRGGYIQDIYARNITVGTVRTFLYLTGHYAAGTDVGATSFANFNNINIDMATVARTTLQPFFIAGADGTKPANGIHLSNITVNASAAPALAAGSGHYQNLTTSAVTVNGAPFSPPASAP